MQVKKIPIYTKQNKNLNLKKKKKEQLAPNIVTINTSIHYVELNKNRQIH